MKEITALDKVKDINSDLNVENGNVVIRGDIVACLSDNAKEGDGHGKMILSSLDTKASTLLIEDTFAEQKKESKHMTQKALLHTKSLPVLSGLLLASRSGKTEIVEELLKVKIDPTTHLQIVPADINQIDGVGNTALHYASMNGHHETVYVLLATTIPSKVDIDIVNFDGSSALHMAAMGGHEKVVEALILQGADSLIVNRDGKIPMEVATNQNAFHILRNCELIRNMRRQLGSMHGFRSRQKTPYKRKSHIRYDPKIYEPVGVMIR